MKEKAARREAMKKSAEVRLVFLTFPYFPPQGAARSRSRIHLRLNAFRPVQQAHFTRARLNRRH